MQTTLNPDDCFLLLVDLQVSSIASVRSIDPSRLKDNAIALATLANIYGIPAILTAGKKPGVGGVFLPELKALLPGHVYIERTQVAAFDVEPVRNAAMGLGRKTILAAGVATDIGLLYAALGAKAEGYDVWAVLDASGTTDCGADDLAKRRLTQAGIVLAGWASLATSLMRDFAGPTSLDTMALLAQRLGAEAGPFQ